MNIFLFLASVVTTFVMVFGIYPNLTSHPLNLTTNILYQASSRNVWALALGFIIYSCVVNGGKLINLFNYLNIFQLNEFYFVIGFIDKFLSLPIWTPLSRLSFSLYLIHYTILTYYIAVLDKPFHLQDISIV